MMRITLYAVMLSLTCLYTSQGCTTWVRCSTGIGGCPSPPPPKVYPTPPPQPYKCECGVRNKVLGKIVGGENADKGEFPWQVNLVHVNTLNQKSTRPFCGGILLSSDTVLTAAHCKSNVLKFNRWYEVKSHTFEFSKLISWRILEIEAYKVKWAKFNKLPS